MQNNNNNKCIVVGCSLSNELKEYQDVEIHFLLHFKKCMECNYVIDHNIEVYNKSQQNQNVAKRELIKLLKDHKISIRHSEKRKNGYFKKRFNSITDIIKFYTINNSNNNENSNKNKNSNCNSNNSNNNDNNNIINNNDNNSINKSNDIDYQNINSDYGIKSRKKIKLENNCYQINMEDSKFVYTRLSEMNIPIDNIEKIFKDKRLVNILSNSNLNPKEEFEDLDFDLKPVIFKSICICEECSLKSISCAERKHHYWSFNIIDLFKSLLATDLTNDIAFYPIPSDSYSLYSSSTHFLRICNENSKSLNIVIKINVDIETIDGNLYNVVYASICNTVSMFGKRFYVGSFPSCVPFQEALTNILKPLLYNHEEISATIKIPDSDKDTKSNPLPIKAIEEAISRKDHYIKNNRIFKSNRQTIDEEFINILISYINIDQDCQNEQEATEENFENINNNKQMVASNQMEDTDDGFEAFQYSELLNDDNQQFKKQMDTQHIAAFFDQNKYNNTGVTNIGLKENNSSKFSSFFNISFTILDVTGNNPHVSEIFSKLINKPDKICRFCNHPRDQMLNFDNSYKIVAIENEYVSNFFNRIKEKMDDDSSIKHFIKVFKESLGIIDYCSVPLYLLKFKDLYNPIDVLYSKELEIMFYELSFILYVTTKKSEKDKKVIKNKKLVQLKNIINSIDRFRSIQFIEDTNELVHFLLELKSNGLLDQNHFKCFLLHLKYYFILRKESLIEKDLIELENIIIQHHQLFIDIYKAEIGNLDSIYINLHSSKHFPNFISIYGSPTNLSTTSYRNKELTNKKVNNSICKNINNIKFLENLSKQFHLLNEKAISSTNIKLGKRLKDRDLQFYSSVTVNGRKYKPFGFYSVFGTEGIWYCQVQSIKESSVIIKYFEYQESKEPSPILCGVTQKAYILDDREYEISLTKSPEALLECVYPIIIDDYYYFISSINN